jgi:hypothetical protein
MDQELLHFKMDSQMFPNDKWKMENGKSAFWSTENPPTKETA